MRGVFYYVIWATIFVDIFVFGNTAALNGKTYCDIYSSTFAENRLYDESYPYITLYANLIVVGEATKITITTKGLFNISIQVYCYLKGNAIASNLTVLNAGISHVPGSKRCSPVLFEMTQRQIGFKAQGIFLIATDNVSDSTVSPTMTLIERGFVKLPFPSVQSNSVGWCENLTMVKMGGDKHSEVCDAVKSNAMQDNACGGINKETLTRQIPYAPPYTVSETAAPPYTVRESAAPPYTVRETAAPPNTVRETAAPPYTVRESAAPPYTVRETEGGSVESHHLEMRRKEHDAQMEVYGKQSHAYDCMAKAYIKWEQTMCGNNIQPPTPANSTPEQASLHSCNTTNQNDYDRT